MSMSIETLRSSLLACESTVAQEASKAGITMAIEDHDADMPNRRISHMLWMSRESLQLIEDGDVEKAMRWLGFLQGALWALKLLNPQQLQDLKRLDLETATKAK